MNRWNKKSFLYTLYQRKQTDSGFQNGKQVKEPQFSKLTYSDAGDYLCEVSMTGLMRRESFQLVVEGE